MLSRLQYNTVDTRHWPAFFLKQVATFRHSCYIYRRVLFSLVTSSQTPLTSLLLAGGVLETTIAPRHSFCRRVFGHLFLPAHAARISP